ncbi:MAG: sigma-54-dependent Fis family transcriptional regulator [bacterium]|nr:sigma-54-dependent Fis family transcriptional regulator [bacterium]
MKNRSILLVEDEIIQRTALEEHLVNNGYVVYSAENVEIALEQVLSKTIDVVITDFNLPDKNGIDLLKQVKKTNPDIPVIIITAYGSIDDAVFAMKAGAFDYLTKPINIEELLLTMKRCLDHRNLVSENLRLKEALKDKYSFKGVIASSRKMQEVLNIAGRVAASKASVLIRGESGTGKEVIGRAIHFASPRKDKSFIAFNVAALSPTLIESELFGHEKGAFTGADRARPGRFVQAHGGTLFIDEIGDIPVELQAKLLRVLQENVVDPLGSTKPVNVDIRIIAATNKDLEKMISENTFREDLYYRLNVVPISIPPLRERKEDIPPLCEMFTNKYSEENNNEVRGFTNEAFDAIMKYDFPGNVRELENLVERAVVLARDVNITLDDLPQHIFNHSGLKANDGKGLTGEVEELEKGLIKTELLKAGGNQSKAARVLEISERKLRYKIQKYRLS